MNQRSAKAATALNRVCARALALICGCVQAIHAQQPNPVVAFNDSSLRTASFRILHLLKNGWESDTSARRRAADLIHLSDAERAQLRDVSADSLAKLVRATVDDATVGMLAKYASVGLASAEFEQPSQALDRLSRIGAPGENSISLFARESVRREATLWLRVQLDSELTKRSADIENLTRDVLVDFVVLGNRITQQKSEALAYVEDRFKHANVSGAIVVAVRRSADELINGSLNRINDDALRIVGDPTVVANHLQRSIAGIERIKIETARAIGTKTVGALRDVGNARSALIGKTDALVVKIRSVDASIRQLNTVDFGRLAASSRQRNEAELRALLGEKQILAELVLGVASGAKEPLDAVASLMRTEAITSHLSPADRRVIEDGQIAVDAAIKLQKVFTGSTPISASSYEAAANSAAAALVAVGVLNRNDADNFRVALHITTDVVKIGAACFGGDPMAGLGAAFDLLGVGGGAFGPPKESAELQLLKGISQQLERVSAQIAQVDAKLDALIDLTRRSFKEMATLSAANHAEVMSAVRLNTEWTKTVARGMGVLLDPVAACSSRDAIKYSSPDGGLPRPPRTIAELASNRRSSLSLGTCVDGFDAVRSNAVTSVATRLLRVTSVLQGAEQSAAMDYEVKILQPSIEFFCRSTAKLDTIFFSVRDSVLAECRSDKNKAWPTMKTGLLRLMQPQTRYSDSTFSHAEAQMRFDSARVNLAVILGDALSPAALDSLVTWVGDVMPYYELEYSDGFVGSDSAYLARAIDDRRGKRAYERQLIERLLELVSYSVSQTSLVSAVPYMRSLKSALNTAAPPRIRVLADSILRSNPWASYNFALSSVSDAIERYGADTLASCDSDKPRFCIGAYSRLWNAVTAPTADSVRRRATLDTLNQNSALCECSFSFDGGTMRVSSGRWEVAAGSAPLLLFAPSPIEVMSGQFAFPPQFERLEELRARLLGMLVSLTLPDTNAEPKHGLSTAQLHWLFLH